MEPIKTRTIRKKNRPAPKPPTVSNLEIRAPSELLLGVPSGLKAQWRHSASTLVSGCIKYNANVSSFFNSNFLKQKGLEAQKRFIENTSEAHLSKKKSNKKKKPYKSIY